MWGEKEEDITGKKGGVTVAAAAAAAAACEFRVLGLMLERVSRLLSHDQMPFMLSCSSLGS